jgi:hypothetical protein
VRSDQSRCLHALAGEAINSSEERADGRSVSANCLPVR